MSFSSMFTGKYPYELTDRRTYTKVAPYTGETLFDCMHSLGFECHVIWDKCFDSYAFPFSNCYGKDGVTTFHCLDIREPVGGHRKNCVTPLERNAKKTANAMSKLYTEIDSISASVESGNLFLWIHLPHVMSGRCGYGDDIDTVDELVGFLREKFGDSSIWLSGDHGHMNFSCGKVGYGWDIQENAVHIPLICPRLEEYSNVNFPTSNVDLMHMIVNKTVVKREFIVIDAQYFAQPYRKTAIIRNRYKYVYDKRKHKEYLYDIEWDRHEDRNLLINKKYDDDRNTIVFTDEVSFYPYKDEIENTYQEMKSILDSFWKVGTFQEEYLFLFKSYILKLKRMLAKKKKEHMFIRDKSRYES